MQSSCNWCALCVLVWSALVSASALPARTSSRKGAVTLPFIRHSRKVTARDDGGVVVGGTVGLGDSQDLFYSVAVTVGNTTVPVNLDTGSADLWIRTSACQTSQCTQSNAGPPYDDSKGFQPSGGDVDLIFGDSVTGTHASGPVGRDTVTLAGLVMEKQPLAAVNDTDNSAVASGGSGILGLGFFSQSFVQAAIVNAETANSSIDTFVEQTASSGPIVSRLIMSDVIDEPLFSITLQRDTIDVSGQGQITIGQLPEGIDNSSLTWVPVRLYDASVGGLSPPSLAPNEVYPLRWEVELDGVFLDDKILSVSSQQAVGIPNPSLSALIDTGNSILRGPNDVVSNILSTVSPAFAADSSAQPTFPCTDAHSLMFQIGGVRFPVDPRDFVSQASGSDGQAACAAGNIVATDAPRSGSLFSWNLGDPFLKSNLVVFYYGNLTHPSVDPPRMGFKSLVPTDAADLLEDAVGDAQKAGGNFESTSDAAPTASSLIHEDGAARATGTANGALSATAISPSGTSGSSATDAAQPNSAQMSLKYAVGGSLWNTLFPVIFGSVIREL
ncbi:acid protease [Trametes versicolor FP-101664 SS1]|uniref:Acid protease n=1 Tax=Trametes versicolor (strain FP-101664) TaxID=717944 RepID=R7S8W2_TRAVS|nr:acid protease [Trametes versicolor FP-101664 SS1]EIW52125.1 acid protease [Trametes versicolor FP-101664 SS1]